MFTTQKTIIRFYVHTFYIRHCAKYELFHSEFLQLMLQNSQFPADLVIFTEESLNEKVHILCSVHCDTSTTCITQETKLQYNNNLNFIFKISYNAKVKWPVFDKNYQHQ